MAAAAAATDDDFNGASKLMLDFVPVYKILDPPHGDHRNFFSRLDAGDGVELYQSSAYQN